MKYVMPTTFIQDGWGYDFRRNMSVSWDEYGDYSTDIFTREAVKVGVGNWDKCLIARRWVFSGLERTTL